MIQQGQHALLRIDQVIAMTGLSNTTIYYMRKRGEFPSPVQISRRKIAWRPADINEWIENPREYDLI